MANSPIMNHATFLLPTSAKGLCDVARTGVLKTTSILGSLGTRCCLGQGQAYLRASPLPPRCGLRGGGSMWAGRLHRTSHRSHRNRLRCRHWKGMGNRVGWRGGDRDNGETAESRRKCAVEKQLRLLRFVCQGFQRPAALAWPTGVHQPKEHRK